MTDHNHHHEHGCEHSEHHHHEHHHHGHHHHHAPMLAANGSLQRIFILSIVINLAYVVIEAVIGLLQNSMSLLSDAGHNLSDVLSLLLVLVAFRLAKVEPKKRFTYGYKKSTVLISLVNAIILLIAVGAIVIESVHKLNNPTTIDGGIISWTAGIGIIINGATALMLMRGQKNDLNVRGAFLHMAADTLVSLGVVVSGLLISLTGWTVIDPIVSMIIAVVILISTWNLLSKSLKLSLDGLPEEVDYDHVKHNMEDIEHVKEVHHLHIWALSTTEYALTAHVVVDDISNMSSIKKTIKIELAKLGITHSTLEFELIGESCNDVGCH